MTLSSHLKCAVMLGQLALTLCIELLLQSLVVVYYTECFVLHSKL